MTGEAMACEHKKMASVQEPSFTDFKKNLIHEQELQCRRIPSLSSLTFGCLSFNLFTTGGGVQSLSVHRM